MKLSYLLYFYKDTSEINQIDFPDVGSPISEQLVIVLLIMILVGWLLVSAIHNKHYYKYLVEGTLIEIIWTSIPAFTLLFIAFPSLQLLYSMDEVIDPSLTIKAIGHQWYWSYEYSDVDDESIEFDSYMIPTSDLEEGDLRLLEVDNKIVVPVNTQVRVVITGAFCCSFFRGKSWCYSRSS